MVGDQAAFAAGAPEGGAEDIRPELIGRQFRGENRDPVEASGEKVIGRGSGRRQRIERDGGEAAAVVVVHFQPDGGAVAGQLREIEIVTAEQDQCVRLRKGQLSAA